MPIARTQSRVQQTVEFGPITNEDILLFALEAASLRLEPEAAEKIGLRSNGDFRLVWRDVRSLEQMARASSTQKVDAKMVGELGELQRPAFGKGGKHAGLRSN